MFTNYSTCFIFNLLAALLKIATTNLDSAEGFKLAVLLEKIGVVEETTFLTWLADWSIRTNEAGWRLAWDLLNICGFVGINFVEVSDVQHLVFTEFFFQVYTKCVTTSTSIPSSSVRHHSTPCSFLSSTEIFSSVEFVKLSRTKLELPLIDKTQMTCTASCVSYSLTTPVITTLV